MQFDFSELLNRHCSIRSYKPDTIDPALVYEICSNAVAGASSSGNLNCVTMILTRDAERKRKLYELHGGQPMVLEAPLLITFCADWYRTRRWLAMRSARDNFNNFIGYHVALIDAAILAQNVSLGFEARGIGICYMGTTLHAMSGISDLLQLPETCVPVTTIVAGYPNEHPSKRDRLPVSAMLHEETYRCPTDEDIDATYTLRETRGWERYMSVPRIKAAIEQHGITSLAQYYTSAIKYDPDVFDADSEALRSLLEDKQFLPRSG